MLRGKEITKEITIEELIDRYSVLLFDAYGVLANSSDTIPGAIELIAELNRMGKPYYVLTNDASALATTRAERYRQFGLDITSDKIITSGSLLKGHFEANDLVGSRCVVLGTKDSERFTELAGGKVVSHADDFDVVVVGDQAGFPFLETIDAVMTALFRKLDAGHDVHLVLPNPDLIFPDADGFGMASRGVSMLLEAALQLRYPKRSELRFVPLGKPHAAIFEEAVRLTGTRDMVMIGDTPETDILGANDFGLDSVLVTTGVASDDISAIADNMRPTYSLASLHLK